MARAKQGAKRLQPKKIPDGFKRRVLDVGGVRTVVYTAGSGAPLLFLHGAGTATGFAYAAAWTKSFTVYHPHHPGFGESGDAPRIGSIRDYVLHYLTLIDTLGLDRVNLVGLSMGGWIAATLATTSSHLLNKLVLVAPAGLKVAAHPATDLFRLTPDRFPATLAHDPQVFLKHLPTPGTPEFLQFLVNNYRESTSWARLAWERNYDPDLDKWLPRISVPTLLLYGDKDLVVPPQQAREWKKLIPNSKVALIKNAGHLVLDEKPEAAEAVRAFLS